MASTCSLSSPASGFYETGSIYFDHALPVLDRSGVEWVFDGQRVDPLSVLHIFAVERCAAGFERCRDDQRVVEPETLTNLNIEPSVRAVNACRNAK